MLITVVCTGNICRSPMAERILQSAVIDAGLRDQVRVDSAGTRGWHEGERAHPNTDRILRDHGYRSGNHRARELTRELFDRADLVLLMDRGHRSDLHRVGFESSEKVHMWRSFDPLSAKRGELDVPDPWGDPLKRYDSVRRMLEAAVPGIMEHVTARLSET